MPFAPEIAIPALMAMRRRYGEHLYGKYGFLDAFNPTLPLRRDGAARQGRAGRRLVRHRLPRHRPGADPGDDREPPHGSGLATDAAQPAHAPRARARGVHRRMAATRSAGDVRRRRARSAAGARSCGGCGAAARRRHRHRPLLGLRPRGRGGARAGAGVRAAPPATSGSRSSRSPGPPRTRSCSPPSSGDATPDAAQLGNTWIPEFVALGALAPLDARLAGNAAAIARGDYFPGIWDTNVVDGDDLGRALVRRHARCSSTAPTSWRATGAAVAAAQLGRVARGDGADQARRAAPTATPSCCPSTSGRSRSSSGCRRRRAARRRRPARHLPRPALPPRHGLLPRPLHARPGAAARRCRASPTSTSSSPRGTSRW